MGRRRQRTEYDGAGAVVKTTRYVYDGNLVIQERDGADNPTATYTRGLDFSLSEQGAGGIGGLLARTIHDGPHGDYSVYYFGDAMGNVRALMGESGTVVADYLYDPFGNLIAASGRRAQENPYRFSTKEHDPVTGLIYFREPS